MTVGAFARLGIIHGGCLRLRLDDGGEGVAVKGTVDTLLVHAAAASQKLLVTKYSWIDERFHADIVHYIKDALEPIVRQGLLLIAENGGR